MIIIISILQTQHPNHRIMQNQIDVANATVTMYRNRFDEAIHTAERFGIDHTDEQANYSIIQIKTWKEWLNHLLSLL